MQAFHFFCSTLFSSRREPRRTMTSIYRDIIRLLFAKKCFIGSNESRLSIWTPMWKTNACRCAGHLLCSTLSCSHKSEKSGRSTLLSHVDISCRSNVEYFLSPLNCCCGFVNVNRTVIKTSMWWVQLKKADHYQKSWDGPLLFFF